MTYYLFYDSVLRGVMIRARIDGGDGVVGRARRVLKPGETFFGHSYDAIKALGDGAFNIEPHPAVPKPLAESAAAPAA